MHWKSRPTSQKLLALAQMS